MLYHAGPGSVLADGQRPSREGWVQPVEASRKTRRTSAIPPVVYVVSDHVGRSSERVAVDSAVGCQSGEPARILGPGQRVERLDRRGRVRATTDISQLLTAAPEGNRRMLVTWANERQQ